MIAKARTLTARSGCPAGSEDAIVVCGRADAGTRYRLPTPRERGARPDDRGGHTGGELLNTPGDCGPWGQRRCTRQEAATQGLGGGRDPVTQAARLVGRLLHPDGYVEVAPRR